MRTCIELAETRGAGPQTETERFVSRVVLFEELPTQCGALISVATLNSEKTLNALSLEMVDLLAERLDAWAKDTKVVLVVLQAAGDKAFCAGGDLQVLYKTMLTHHAAANHGDPLGNTYAAEFFSREYRLDYLIHTYPKPVLCWGHGIVMGGGVGLMSGASHRVVTERSRVAMPEISIGLYPDVGGSWLLSRVARNAGVFLALTGAPLNASDALFAGFAEYQLAQATKPEVMAGLATVQWTDSRADNDRLLGNLLRKFDTSRELGPGPLQTNLDLIGSICVQRDLQDIVSDIVRFEDEQPACAASDAEPDPGKLWLKNAAKTLSAGSPGTARLAFTLQQRARNLSLAQVFRMEYIVSLHCATHTDFAEGIRALLIDKDRQPHWNPASMGDASAKWVEWFFESPWAPAGHPLADLDDQQHVDA
jgi:enoyl-CoA hydratase/carnithine racemase